MMSKILTIAFLFVFVFAAAAYAECDFCKVANQSTSSNYVEYTAARLAQGFGNAAFCWLELGLQPVKASAKAKAGDCPLNVAGEGIANGVGSFGYRAAQGVGEILTAFWPQRVLAPAECEVCNVEEMKAQRIVS